MGLDESIQNKINRFFDAVASMSTEYITQAQKDGRIVKSVNAETASICIIGSVKEIVFKWAVLEENIDTVKAIENMLEIFLYGMLTEDHKER